MLKKVVSILLIISILLLSVVPSFAVGELAVSGLATLATSLGFTSVAPLLGIVAGIIAAGIVIDASNLIPLVTNYVRTHWNATQTESLTAAGTETGSTLSNDAVINFNHYAQDLANSTARDTLRLGAVSIESTWGSLYKAPYSSVDFNRIAWQPTYDPAIIGGIFYDTQYGDFSFVTFNYLTHELALYCNHISGTPSDDTIVGASLTYRYGSNFGCSFNKGSGYLSPTACEQVSSSTPLYTNNLSYINSHWGHATLHTTTAYPIIFYPNSGYNTYATSDATGTLNTFSASTVTSALTDNTVIGIPSTWTQPTDDDDIFVIPDVGTLAPGNVIIPEDVDDPSIPGVIGGSIAWEDAPAIDEPDSSLPEWTFRIPILGSIARLLQWLGNLLKQLGNWITSLWETIVGWWTQLLDKIGQILGSITGFFADARQFFRDILDHLKGSDLSRFVSSVLGFISGYTLYNTLFTAYLPQCVAAVLWAAWLTLMCFWILRMVLDR